MFILYDAFCNKFGTISYGKIHSRDTKRKEIERNMENGAVGKE